MKSRSKFLQSGFTLVELAIVLLIVGLLISGILKGQELIENSRTTATIQQIKAYEAAVNTFRDSFGGLPGDMRLAVSRVPGCVTATNACANGDGDGLIGGSAEAGTASGAVGTERTQFWLHMALANLITGVVPNYVTNTALSWGTTLPAGRITGGFLVGYGNAIANGSAGPFSGHYIVLQATPTNAANAAAGLGVALSPNRASQMDLKLDDGQPGTGDVLGIGTAAATGCFSAATAAGTYSVNTQPTCSMATKIMN